MNAFLGNKLVQKQQMALTPKMVEELKILQMSNIDLIQYINEQMIENPLLEADMAETSEDGEISNAEDEELQYDESQDYDYWDKDFQKNDFTEYSSSTQTLRQHLLLQLHEISVPMPYLQSAIYIIENIDDDGYLTCGIRSIASAMNIPEWMASKALKIVQGLDPAGVGARSLKESLIIQLKNNGQLSDEIRDFILNHLEQLAQRKYSEISHETGLPKNQIVKIHGLIKGLDPRPGRKFGNADEIFYIVPELEIKVIDGEFIVIFFKEKAFDIKISNYYKRLIGDEKNSSETNRYIRTKLSKAKELINAVEQRKRTVLNVATCIVGFQTEFFKKGHQYLKPLTLKMVADMAGIHESTVSRTINDKYIHTPRGTYELKYFFSSQADDMNTGVSANGVKKLIARIINAEDKSNPLSDEQIKKELEKAGIHIARRTVAKYRESLGILSIALRG